MGYSIFCPKHRDWKLVKAPTSDCKVCNAMWLAVRFGAKTRYS